ncbi:hypothetical protein J3458_016878 [Metarhizium acridum]|uniref:uncharacterized protein n=1 Tax=Metarhizium acridum TaxID=92637 RepID=UPI001C6BB0E4|nr:hypothetical protein J3458_016878 [Metarhizium acridum]
MQKRAPPADKVIITQRGHSVLINSPLEKLLNERGIKSLLTAGMQTDVAVSTAVRMAHNSRAGGEIGRQGNVADAPGAPIWRDGKGMYVKEQDPDPVQGEESVDGFLVDMTRIVLIGDATERLERLGFTPKSFMKCILRN